MGATTGVDVGVEWWFNAGGDACGRQGDRQRRSCCRGIPPFGVGVKNACRRGGGRSGATSAGYGRLIALEMEEK